MFLDPQTYPYPLRLCQFILAVFIFAYFALKPASGMQAFSLSPLILHFVGNVLLGLSVWLAFYKTIRTPWLFLIMAFYSLLMEASQGLTATRVPDLTDATVNLLGIFVGFIIVISLEKQIKK